jgi:hypothetical protein
MNFFLLQSTSINGVLAQTAAKSIGSVVGYIPYALVGAVIVAFGLVYMARKRAGGGFGGGGGLMGNVKSFGGAGASPTGGGMMNPNVSYMFIYSRVQRRIINVRPFVIDRKKDSSGNILEKKAIYLDSMSRPDRFANLKNVFSRLTGRGGGPPQEEYREETSFDESLAVGAPNGGWFARLTLEENLQVPFFPDVVNNTNNNDYADQIKRIIEQSDKRISRLKEAALTLNQYRNSANSFLRNAFGKEMMAIGVLILIGLIVIGYYTGVLANATTHLASTIATVQTAVHNSTVSH